MMTNDQIAPVAPKPLEIFYSYAHEDEELRDRLEQHFSLLKRQGFITGWHDRQITAGRPWKDEIDAHLESAGIILLLISSDFMASDYCHDKEMKRAMERHAEGKARVIPIILRPVDWKGAVFSELQCLPRNAVPVTEWRNTDAAFVSIAQGIRRIAEDIHKQDAADSHARAGKVRRRRYAQWIAASLCLILAGIGAWFIYDTWHRGQETLKSHLASGKRYLDIGRHDAAAREYRQVLEKDPNNAGAQLGLLKAGVYDPVDGHYDPAVIEQRIKRILNSNPDDPHAYVFLGDLYAPSEPLKAIEHYQKAKSLDPDIAKAWFGLSILYDKQGRTGEALGALEEAVKRSDFIKPEYLNNLAYLYLQQERYPQAIQAYERTLSLDPDFVLAYCEIANAYRLAGAPENWEAARSYQEKALALLQNENIAGLDKNRAPWYFKIDGRPVYLSDPPEKTAYLYYSLAATLYLLDRAAEAEHTLSRARQLDTDPSRAVRALVDYDLQRLARSAGPLAQRKIADYRQRLIPSWEAPLKPKRISPWR